MLNKTFLIKELCEKIYDNACYDGEKPLELDNIDELHDDLLDIEVNGIAIEEYDALYWKMNSIINSDGKEMIDEINNFIDEEFQSYYLDPAFSSPSDYWGYILGR